MVLGFVHGKGGGVLGREVGDLGDYFGGGLLTYWVEWEMGGRMSDGQAVRVDAGHNHVRASATPFPL